MNLFKRNLKIDLNKVPEHIAVIMDGNGRWAQKRGLPRSAGHQAGAKKVEELVVNASEYGIKVLTLFAFSTENWKRPQDELNHIFSLVKKFLLEGKNKFKENNVRILFMGKIEELDNELKSLMYEMMEETKDNKTITLNIAVNYGSRSEIIEATKKIAKECVDGKQNIEDIDEACVEKHLMSNSLPNIDLLVRTSGEIRLSNFLLWQVAYSELVFTKVYWPDFDKKELEKVLIEFQSRNRRFGGLN